MNHGIKGRKLNRRMGHRKALFSNLCKALINAEQIITTLPKAKDLRPIVEKLITLGKKGDLHARRQVAAYIGDSNETKKLFAEVAPRFKSRNGGYTRIIKAGFRTGDAAPMAVIEFVERQQ